MLPFLSHLLRWFGQGLQTPPVRLTAGLQVTRRWSGTGRPAVAVGGGSREPRPTNLDKTDSSPVLNERPVEISRGFWNSSAVGTRKWVQPTAAQLGIALLFLSTRSPSLNLIERRVKVTLRCAYAVAGSRFFRHFHATIQWLSALRQTSDILQPIPLKASILHQFGDANSLLHKV